MLNILLVEDDDIDARRIVRDASESGLDIEFLRARDGVHALELLDSMSKCPPIALIDLNMPRLGGLELIERLRADPKTRRMILFVLSTSSSEEDVQKAYDSSIAGYLVKSVTNPKLDQLIELLEVYSDSVHLPENESA